MYLLKNIRLLWNRLLRSDSIYDPEHEDDIPETPAQSAYDSDDDDSASLFEKQSSYAAELVRASADEDAVKAIEDRLDLMNTALTGFRTQWKEHDSQCDTRISVLETRVSETERRNNDYTEFNNRISELVMRLDALEEAMNGIQDEVPEQDDDDDDSTKEISSNTTLDLENVDKKFRAYGNIYARLTAELKNERAMRIEQENKIETILTVNRMLAAKVAKLEGVSVPVGVYSFDGAKDGGAEENAPETGEKPADTAAEDGSGV
ncbi:MAG: hypothetical protein IJ874_05850 [Ruminococcus sp.]|nr:hypothetical protein [Ruminococcus sp.]